MKQNATKKNKLFCKIWKLNRTELQSDKIEKTDHNGFGNKFEQIDNQIKNVKESKLDEETLQKLQQIPKCQDPHEKRNQPGLVVS